ncbi:MAG: recombinase zinc beta ribbon domain-containing protein, partial [Cellulosilyticaceae bacterium]
YNKVQCILENNFKGDSQSHRENVNTHIFSGLIYCNKCGTRFWGGLDNKRKDGYRPSRYVCYKQQGKLCSNFISDITLLPFMLNYIANFIHLQERITSKHTLRDVERMLLRGEAFTQVAGIDKKSLEKTYLCFAQGFEDEDFDKPEVKEHLPSAVDMELEDLKANKKKYDTALQRLQDLYLFSSESMAEKDFIFKKRDITAQLTQIDERIHELQKKQVSVEPVADLSWTTQASYFLMTQELTKKRHINYRDVVASIDADLIHAFMQAVIERIQVEDKKIISITFRNGLEHTFAYKEKPITPVGTLMYAKYEDKLLRYMKLHEEVTNKDIRELTGLSRSSCGRLLEEFIQRGLISRSGNSVATIYILNTQSKNDRESS